MDLAASILLLINGGSVLQVSDYEELDVRYSVVSLDATKARAAFCAEVRYETGPIRYTLHGADPTTSFGLPAFDGSREIFGKGELEAFRAIKSGSTDGKVRVVYYKKP